MIAYVQSSLFVSPARTLVNTVNTVGVMGKGLAKVFRDIYPELFALYKERCERGEIAPGVLQLYRTPHKSVLNFPTKRHWRQPSRLEDIEAGLRTFTASYADHGLTSIAFPQLGCGNGGLDWERQVRPLMERYLAPLAVDVHIHVPPPGGGMGLPAGWDEDRLRRWLRADPAPVTFGEFCGELLALMTSRSDLGWETILSEADLEVHFLRADVELALTEDDIFAIWQRLDGFGLLGPADLETRLGAIVPTILSVMAELPYVERVVWAMAASELGSLGSQGLLYLPPSEPLARPDSEPRQAVLFSETAVA